MLNNPAETTDKLITWIRTYFAQNGPTCSAVIGISGGKDSTVAAALCAKALGADRVVGVLMPDGRQDDFADALAVVETLKIQYITIDLKKIYNPDALSAIGSFINPARPTDEKSQAEINFPPRLRMALLYYVAQSLPCGGRVVNTCNLSEDYVGFLTKYGDGAGDFAPLANLTVEEVLQIGDELGLPHFLVHKTPSDGLCGENDEDKLGFTYARLDAFISRRELPPDDVLAKIVHLNRTNLHKHRPMPSFADPTIARAIPEDWRTN